MSNKKGIWVLKCLCGTPETYIKNFWFNEPSLEDLIQAGVRDIYAKNLLGFLDSENITNHAWELIEVKEGGNLNPRGAL